MKISAVDAKKLMNNVKNIKIVDVREPEEIEEGYIENSILIPLATVEYNILKLIPDKKTTILVYCRSGRRSELAAEIMEKLGYENIYDFGGIIDWPFDVVI